MKQELIDKIQQSHLLLVGAGGVGCEVLKNLTLSGFRNIDVIDLDTINVSNLNRQFLFNKENVGQSKSEVAVRIAREDYSSSTSTNLKSIHKSITSQEFDVDYYKQYTIVINALDNRAARSHVNRMCLSADVPLIESGTAGYTGQCRLIKNALTSCYECEGIQKEGRTYAACTIRNTPSQPVHCVVWAKHLFHELFGEEDPDNDISPANETEIENGHQTSNGDTHSEAKRISTREWATRNQYDPVLLIHKLYNEDIHCLLRMENLWKQRQRPRTLDYGDLVAENGVKAPSTSSNSEAPTHSRDHNINQDEQQSLNTQRLWTLTECAQVFCESVRQLQKRMESSGHQYWDKDDELAMNFVAAAANLRCSCFYIERKSLFDMKSLAGNIIPAISSTNSIIGGLVVLQAIKILNALPKEKTGDHTATNELLKDATRQSYLNFTSLTRQDLIASYECPPPIETCLACARGSTPVIDIHISMKSTTLGDLVDKCIVGTFHFVCPDVSLDNDSGIIIWSNDDSDEISKAKKLVDIPHIKPPKTRLLVSDLLQDKSLSLALIDEEIDEEKQKNFFYAQINGKDI